MNKQQTFEKLINDLIDNLIDKGRDVTTYADLHCKYCHGGGNVIVRVPDILQQYGFEERSVRCECLYKSAVLRVFAIKGFVTKCLTLDEIKWLISELIED